MPSRNLLTVIASAIITVTLGGVTSVGLATEVKGVNFSVTASAAVAPAVTDVTLTANTATGDAMLVFNNPSAQFYAWEITSSTGGLSYTNLTDLPNFGSGLHARGPTALDGVYSGYATGGYYNPGGTWNLGDIINPADIASGTLDFSFNEFNPTTGFSVNFDPGTINYTSSVPAPATLGLLALGGVGLLLMRRRNKVA